jgi:nucleotide-binding universal stress UspA family protein
VLTVPPRAPDAVPIPSFKNILCAIDFSDSSLKALHYASSLAQETDARLTVLHVIELPVSGEHASVGSTDVLRQYAVATEQERRDTLKTVVPDAVRAYCHVETELRKGKPYREILQAAAERKSDVIVMGVQGRGPVDLAFFGSTAQHVVRQAVCPVLTLRVT